MREAKLFSSSKPSSSAGPATASVAAPAGQGTLRDADFLAGRGPPSLLRFAVRRMFTLPGLAEHEVLAQLGGAGSAPSGVSGTQSSAALELLAAAAAAHGMGPLALQEFLAFVSQDSEEDRTNPLERGVCITTIHSAKGLEWDDVYLPLMYEGFLPSDFNPSTPEEQLGARDQRPERPLWLGDVQLLERLGQGADLEEQRRLAHVGATRARSRLLISHPSYTVDRDGWQREVRCSSFLDPVVAAYSDTPVLALERGLGAPQPLPAGEEGEQAVVAEEEEGVDLVEALGGVADDEGWAAAGDEDAAAEEGDEEDGPLVALAEEDAD